MIENGEDQEAVLAILRERARQLDLDIEVLTGRRAEVLGLITSIQPDARRRRKPRTPAIEPGPVVQQARWPGDDLLAPAQEAQEQQPKRGNGPGTRVPGGVG